MKNTLFLVGVGAARAQDGPHDHSDDGEHTNRHNHHDHQNMILLAARDAWFIWHRERDSVTSPLVLMSHVSVFIECLPVYPCLIQSRAPVESGDRVWLAALQTRHQFNWIYLYIMFYMYFNIIIDSIFVTS